MATKGIHITQQIISIAPKTMHHIGHDFVVRAPSPSQASYVIEMLNSLIVAAITTSSRMGDMYRHDSNMMKGGRRPVISSQSSQNLFRPYR